MSTKLRAELLERGYTNTNNDFSTTHLYIANQNPTNKRVLIKGYEDGFTFNTSNLPDVSVNNNTLTVDQIKNFLSFCTSPKAQISCAGATSFVFLSGLGGLYTVEINGHTIISMQSMATLPTNINSNVFMRDLGIIVTSFPSSDPGIPPYYLIMIEDDVNVKSARVRIKYESESGTNIGYIQPHLVSDLLGISADIIPNFIPNTTIGNTSNDFYFCLENSIISPVCHNFNSLNYNLDNNNLSDRVLTVFPNTTDYQLSSFNISINGVPASIFYEELPTQLVNLDNTPHVHRQYRMVADVVYTWDVTDYDTLPESSRPDYIIRGWVRVDNDRKIDDNFIFCFNGFFENGDSAPFLDRPSGNPIIASSRNTRYVRTQLSSKYHSVSIHGRAAYLPWLQLPSDFNYAFAKDTRQSHITYDDISFNGTDTYTITYPYHNPALQQSSAVFTVDLIRSIIQSSKINQFESFVTIELDGFVNSYNKLNLTNRFSERPENNTYTSTNYLSASKNYIFKINLDYDGERNDYTPTERTIYINSVIKPGMIPSEYDVNLLTPDDYTDAGIDKNSIYGTITPSPDNNSSTFTFIFPWNPASDYLNTISEQVFVDLDSTKITNDIVVNIHTKDDQGNIINTVTKRRNDLTTINGKVGVLVTSSGSKVHYTIEVDYDGPADLYNTGTYDLDIISTVAPRPTFDLTCTGAFDDVAIVTDPNQTYSVIIDGVVSPLMTRDEMIGYLSNQPGLEVKLNNGTVVTPPIVDPEPPITPPSFNCSGATNAITITGDMDENNFSLQDIIVKDLNTGEEWSFIDDILNDTTPITISALINGFEFTVKDDPIAIAFQFVPANQTTLSNIVIDSSNPTVILDSDGWWKGCLIP